MSHALPGSRVLPVTLIDLPNTAEKQEPVPGGAGFSKESPPPALLHVAGTAISEVEIAREMQHHPAAEPARARADAARALVVRELLRLEIERLGLTETVEPEGQETREEACIRVLLEREVTTPMPGEKDCRRYFEQNRERFRVSDRVQARHILIAAAPDDIGARLAAREQAEFLIDELTGHPERFTEYAQRFSACPSKDEGGELGWLIRGQTTPEFDRQLFMLREGLAGLPVESRYGYHVVCVDAIERGAALEFNAVHARIADYLETQVRQKAVWQYLSLLETRYPVAGLQEIEAQAA